MPEALPGEGAFAASGTCLVAQGSRNAWFGTGGRAGLPHAPTGAGPGRPTRRPIRAGGGSSGVFSLAFRDAEHGVAVGGDYKEPGRADRVAAVTSDGGRSWRSPQGSGPGGYRSAVAYLAGAQGPTLVAVGPTGADLSRDGGETWTRFGDTGFHAVGSAGMGAGWAVGEDGRIARFDMSPTGAKP